MLVNTIDDRLALFTSIDRTFVIEAALCKAIIGPEGDKIMEAKIIKAFPTPDNLKKLDLTSQELKVIKESSVARRTGPAAAQMLQAAVEVVDGMLRGCCPEQKFMTSGIMMKLSPLLPLFCQTSVEIEGKTTIVTGAAATKELLQNIQDKQDNEEAVSFNDLEPLHAFQWLLDKKGQDELTELTKALVSTVTSPSSKGGSNTPSGASKPKVHGGKKASKDDDTQLADVMSLFT